MSSTVEAWFDDWVDRFVTASCRTDYPVNGSEHGEPYWKVVIEAFKRYGVTEAAADDAIGRTHETSLFPDAAREKVIENAKKAQAGLSNQPRAQAGTREAAKLDTPEGCECSQTGLVIRFRHKSAGNGLKSNAAGYKFTCYCVCPMGRWIKAQHDVDTRRLFLDLAEHQQLQLRRLAGSDILDNPHRYHPDHWNAVDDRPVLVESQYAAHVDYRAKHGANALRDMFRKETAVAASKFKDAATKRGAVPPQPRRGVGPKDWREADDNLAFAVARMTGAEKALYEQSPPNVRRKADDLMRAHGEPDEAAEVLRAWAKSLVRHIPPDREDIQDSRIDHSDSLDYNPGRSDQESDGPDGNDYDFV